MPEQAIQTSIVDELKAEKDYGFNMQSGNLNQDPFGRNPVSGLGDYEQTLKEDILGINQSGFQTAKMREKKKEFAQDYFNKKAEKASGVEVEDGTVLGPGEAPGDLVSLEDQLAEQAAAEQAQAAKIEAERRELQEINAAAAREQAAAEREAEIDANREAARDAQNAQNARDAAAAANAAATAAAQRELNRTSQYSRGNGGGGGGGGGGGSGDSNSPGGGGSYCFDPSTPIQMANGSTKEIKNIQLGDDTKGGEVTGVFQFKASDDIHNYKGVTVAGGHYVKENNEFIMVKDSPLAVKIDKIPVVYSLDTSARRIFIKDIEFADYNGDGVAKNFLSNAGVTLEGFDKEVLRQVQQRLI
jgi:hypothetical protein